MNLVTTELRARLRQGLTQAQLSQQLKIPTSTLSHLLNGVREAGPSVLKALGIERHTVYTYAAIPPEVGKTPETPRKARKIVNKPAPQAKSQPKLWPGLTAARVQIAVRYELNPRISWDAFCASDPDPAKLDEAWLAHCAKNGTAPAAQPLDSPFPKGSLYAHLKAQPMRPDHRKPLELGEVPPLMTIDQPTVSRSVMAEAERQHENA